MSDTGNKIVTQLWLILYDSNKQVKVLAEIFVKIFFFVKKPIFTTNFLHYINFWCNYVISTCFKQHPSSVLILLTKILKETRNGSFRIDISWFKAGGCIFTTYGRLFKQAVACFKRESACFGFVKIWDKQFCPNQPQ